MSLDVLFLLAVGGELKAEFPSLQMVLLYLLGIVVFLILNALFVAVEFALVKVRKSQLVEAQERRPRRANLALHAVARLDGYLSAGQLGITVASLALGMLGEPLVASIIGPILLRTPLAEYEWAIHLLSFLIAAGSFSFVHVVIGEQVPKVLAIRKPVPMTLWLISPLHWFYRSFRWAIWTINGSAGFILRKVFKVEPAGHDEVHSAEELAQLVEESERHDEVTQTEREILINALELNDLKVQDVMLPRSDVVYFDVDDTFAKNLELAVRTKHTRFPLVRGHLDSALGLIHIKDLLMLTLEDNPDLMQIKRELKIVPETMPLDTLLSFFLHEKVHLAMVVDEFGDPSGLVFLDNVIEELVGDIQDEFDNERSPFTRVNENEFIVEGAISLNELSDHVPSLELESGEVTTVGGYITQQLGHLPEPGEGLEIEKYEATVTSTDGRRVGQVYFRKLDPEEEEGREVGSEVEGVA